MNQYIYDGIKTVNINQLPAEAWTRLGGGASGKDAEIQERYIRVPFLNRAVKLRSNAVSSLPFAILNESGVEIDTSEDYQNKLEFLPNPQKLLEQIEASLFLTARAYLFQRFNRAKELGLDGLAGVYDLRYMVPSSISEK